MTVRFKSRIPYTRLPNDYVYATAYGADDVLDAIPLKGSALSFKGNSSVEAYPVIRYKTDISSGALAKGQGAMGNGDCKSTFSNNHRRRIKGEMWATWWFIHTSVGSEIEAQRRRFRRWKQTRMSRITMTITGHVEYTVESSGSGNTATVRKNIDYYRSKSEAKEIRASHYGTSDWSEVDLDGHFTGTYSGRYKSCTSSFFKQK